MSNALRIGVCFAVAVLGLWGCGSGTKEVEVQAPSTEERDAQLEKMTPEQRQAAEAMLQAVRSQAESSSQSQRSSE